MNTLIAADAAFAALPAKVRDHFNNDPAAFLAAFSDKSQEAQLREFGLLKPLPAVAAVAGVGAPPAAPEG